MYERRAMSRSLIRSSSASASACLLRFVSSAPNPHYVWYVS